MGCALPTGAMVERRTITCAAPSHRSPLTPLGAPSGSETSRCTRSSSSVARGSTRIGPCRCRVMFWSLTLPAHAVRRRAETRPVRRAPLHHAGRAAVSERMRMQRTAASCRRQRTGEPIAPRRLFGAMNFGAMD